MVVSLTLERMEQLFDVLKETQGKRFGPPNAVLDMVHEWKGMGENLFKYVLDYVSDIESREKNLGLVRESLEKRMKDLEEREKDFDLFRERKMKELALKEERLNPMLKDFAKEVEIKEEKLDEQLKLVHEHIESLEVAQSEVEGLRLLQLEKLKEIEKREREVDFMSGSLEKRLREVEQREKEFDSIQDGKLKELASKEELLSWKREQFVKEVKLAHEKVRETEKLGFALIKRLGLAVDMLDSMKVKLDVRFEEIESMVTVAHNSLAARLDEADLIRKSLDKQFKELEKMEEEFCSFQENKMRKLESKERQLSIMRKEHLKEVKLLRDEKLREQQKLGHQLLESLEEMVAKKLKKIESRELTLNRAHEALDASAKDAEIKGELANIWLQELEKKGEEFLLNQENKKRELLSAEEKLRLIGKEFIQEVNFREGNFDKQEKMVHGLLERLELALNNVKDMNALVSERFKEIHLKEVELNHIRDQLERKMDELEYQAKELGGQEKGIKVQVEGVNSKENELEGKKKERELKEGCFKPWRKELECKERYLEELDDVEKNLNCVREFTENCFKENKLHQLEYLPENHDGYLAENDRQPKCMPRELESKSEQELKQQQLTDTLDTHSRIEQNKSADLNSNAVQKDGKTLEMFINGTGKDLELMNDEVFKVLLQSSDPAKLVLDTIEGFYMLHLGRGDIDFNMRRTCIVLLDQLTKMSLKIQPSVREAATKLASEWKSKLRITAENPLQVLGFLHFLAAFNLSTCFDKDELLSLMKTVARHRQTPELCCILGLTEKIHGFIQNLINEKQYLLASTYIYECELDSMFPQSAVLDYYVRHAKMSAKAKCKRAHNSSEAHVKAIASEIADLQVAIDHVVKYGLESEYSPDVLKAWIRQLERDRASLKKEMPSPSADLRKQEKSNRSAGSQDANKGKAQQKHEVMKEAVPDPKPKPPEQSSQVGSSPACKAQHMLIKRREHHATEPDGSHEPCSQQEEATKSLQLTGHVDAHTASAKKRRRLHEPERPKLRR